MTYNVPCINSLVVYVGSQAILQLNNKTPIITHSAPMDVFHQVTDSWTLSVCSMLSKYKLLLLHKIFESDDHIGSDDKTCVAWCGKSITYSRARRPLV